MCQVVCLFLSIDSGSAGCRVAMAGSVGARRFHRAAGNWATRFLAASLVCAIRADRMSYGGACRAGCRRYDPYSRCERQDMSLSPISRRAEPDPAIATRHPALYLGLRRGLELNKMREQNEWRLKEGM
jgi:hypothetical protein